MPTDGEDHPNRFRDDETLDVERQWIDKVASPQRLGDFRLLREIGRGGMGVVFEAEQLSLRRRVAIKILPFGTVSDPDAVDRFHREAATVAHLHHTNIVPIFYVGSEHGVNYYAMEFIQGRSLADVLIERGQAIEPLIAIEWGYQAAEALAHAHHRGVIHRDIKPSNLLLDEEGRIWLTDFGLAKRQDDVTLSRTGALLGTPRYMSPEQASAARHQLDHRTDIYSLGATLYELLTGQPVFSAETPHQVIQQILTQAPVPPRQRTPGLSRDMETLLLKCLQKEPEQRYQSAQALADDFRAILDGRAIRARRASLTTRSVQWIRRHRRSVTLAGRSVAATAALLLLIFLAAVWHDKRQAVHVSLTTDQPPLVAEIRRPDQHTVALQTIPTQQAIDVPAGRYQLRISGKSRLSETFQLDLERGHSPQFDVNLDESLLSLPLPIERSYRIVSADGRSVILSLGDQEIRCFDRQHQEPRWTVSVRAPDAHPSWASVPGWVWPWNRLTTSSPYYGWGSFDLRPFVTASAVDLNADGVDDFLLATRHQACLFALSGQDGSLLWHSARSQDLLEPFADPFARYQRGVLSGVLAEPLPVGDVNRDGTSDFVVSLADGFQSENGVRRWLECISGQTGQSLWQRDLSDDWFLAASRPDIPDDFRWFQGSGAASSRRGGSGGLSTPHLLKRDLPDLQRTGYFHHVASTPLRISTKDEGQTQNRLALLAGSRVLIYDVATGEPIGDPIDCQMQPGQEPIVADVDGDGADELVLLQEQSSQVLPGGTMPTPRIRMGVFSPTQRGLLWKHDLQADWPRPDWTQMPVAAARWPVIADLDGDQRAELIVPCGTSKSARNATAAWGEIEVLDGTTGQRRWKRRIKSMDQRVERFVVGPDVDGDGVAEVFTATLWSPRFDLYVDAISGRDGSSVWIGRQPLRKPTDATRFHLANLSWWQAGSDGWPQLVVPVSAAAETPADSVVCMFSAGSGELTQLASKLTELQTTDADGDGTEDLYAFQPTHPTSLDAGGTLFGFRGQPRELWKSIGQHWTGTIDLDGDGIRDLTRVGADATVYAVSGRSSQLLWRVKPPESDLHQLTVVAAVAQPAGRWSPGGLAEEWQSQNIRSPVAPEALHPGDLDRDGTVDLLAYVHHLGKPQPTAPLFALSGRTGRRLWTAELKTRYVADVLALNARDLDGDGITEIIWIGTSDWGFPETRSFNIHQKQLSLVVLSGSDGKILWHQALSQAYGLTPQATPAPAEFDQGSVATCEHDLNGDGVLDLLVPADPPSATDRHLKQWRALDGRTGNALWHYDLPPVRFEPRAFSDLPPPAVADLNGDGHGEVLILSFEAAPSGNRSFAVLRALEGSNGNQLWSRSFEVPNECGQLVFGDHYNAYRPRPLPLRTAAGTSWLALNLWDGPERVVVVDEKGRDVSDFRLDTQRGYHRGKFQLRSWDTNQDGNDELLLTHRDHLMAVRPQQPQQPLWQHPIDHLWTDEIEGILPPTDKHPAQIVVQRKESPRSVYGLDAASGKLQWTVATPSVRREGQTLPLEAGQVAVLSDGNSEHPPWLFYQQQFLSRVREASKSDGTSATHTPANLSRITADPRHEQPLPWAPAQATLAAMPTALAWAAFYCMTLLVIPGVYLLQMIRRRRWSLQWLLLGPVIAIPPTFALLTDAPESQIANLAAKLFVAALALPVFLAAIQLFSWTLRQRWRLVGMWVAIWLIASALLAATALLVTQSLDPVTFEEGDYYTWSGWWFIGLYGTYIAALLLAAWQILLTGSRGATSLWASSRRALSVGQGPSSEGPT